ncbi:MAG: transglycosylase domain-containing protein [bacterium]|nr:transglycosylase domain-containing protein [bacterium]
MGECTVYIVKKKNNKPRKKHHFFVILTFLFFVCIITSIALGVNYIVTNAPTFDKRNLYMSQASILLDKNGKEITRLGLEDREIVTYNELPQVLIDAIVATEDSRFFQHQGFDLIRFSKAVFDHLNGNTDAGGASTITMQISKQVFTSNVATGIEGIIRKLTDIYLSMFQIEKNYTKEEILEIYVNYPFLGSHSYGVEMACQNYFGKSVREINLAEAALIAGLFNAPSDIDPNVNLYNATKRRNEVLNLMYKHGYITEEQLNDALNISVSSMLIKKSSGVNKYQSFIDTVTEEIIKDKGISPYNVPMIIQTTLDTSVQDAVNNVMNNSKNFKDDVIQAGMVITSTADGSILAIGGGRNRTGARQYNYATQIKRQPGSSIKPFMDYGPYFEFNGGTPNDIILDAPYTYSDGTQIVNAMRDYKGYITIKQALSDSRNIPALKVFQQVDKTNIANYVHSFGIDYGSNLYESAAVGAFEGVSPLQMSAAYGAYARGGYYIEPYSYTRITYRDNNEVEEKTYKKEKVCSEQTAKYINEILTYAIKYGKILGTLDVGNAEVAGKTGTTTISRSKTEALGISEYAVRDSWACIYTHDYSVALWYGYANETSEYYMLNIDATLGRRRIMKKLAKLLITNDKKLLTSEKN